MQFSTQFKNSWASINQKVFTEHPLSARVGPEIENRKENSIKKGKTAKHKTEAAAAAFQLKAAWIFPLFREPLENFGGIRILFYRESDLY